MALWKGEPEITTGLEPGTLNQVDIQVAVVVIVKEGNAGTHDFGHVELPG
jgi:hypothetical protein